MRQYTSTSSNIRADGNLQFSSKFYLLVDGLLDCCAMSLSPPQSSYTMLLLLGKSHVNGEPEIENRCGHIQPELSREAGRKRPCIAFRNNSLQNFFSSPLFFSLTNSEEKRYLHYKFEIPTYKQHNILFLIF